MGESGGENLPEKNRAVAVFDFLLGLVELGLAYAFYQAYSAVNALYYSNTSSFITPLVGQLYSAVITGLILLAIFVAVHAIKRILENLAVFVSAAAAASRNMQTASTS